jgi:hypothetical protein
MLPPLFNCDPGDETTTTATWVAGWNIPGCLPDSADDPNTFDSFRSARDYIAEELERLLDQADIVDDAHHVYDDPRPEIRKALGEARTATENFSVFVCGYNYWVDFVVED